MEEVTVVKEDYDFPVSVEPVHDMNNVPIENYRLIRRLDTNKILTINSERYSIRTHKDVVDVAENALGEFEDLRHADIFTNLIRYGARMFRTYTFNQIQINIDEGDPVAMMLCLNNSYDRTARVGFTLGARRAHRVYPIGGKAFDTYRHKHFEGLNLQDAKQQIQSAISNWTLLEKTWKEWKNETLTNSLGETLIKKAKLPEKYQELITERWSLSADLTKWKLYDISCIVIEEIKKSGERAEVLGNQLVKVFYR